MKEFLKTNTVTHNLMSFTAFKSILIFKLLLEGPKTYDELKTAIASHEYLNETISTDTLRIYINSLKKIGCTIGKISVNGKSKYYLNSHPLQIRFNEKQIKSIIKVFKAISKTIDVEDLISLQQFFNKLSQYISNDELKNTLKALSPLNNIDQNLIKELLLYARENLEITINYNSPNSGKKDITILVDKLSINNGKLYVHGYNSHYNNYASFLVSRIIEIIAINYEEKTLNIPETVIGYEYYISDNENLELLSNEKIIKSDEKKYLIEITTKNKFQAIQRLMYHANNCKILYPENIKEEVISNFKKMKEEYLGK